MKTSEFIKRVEEMGYEVKEGVGYEIYHAGKIVSRVFKMHESVVDTSLSEFRYLNNRDRMDLLDLIVEYAKTPIEERKDVKKYYLYNPVRDAYFSYCEKDRTYSWYGSVQMFTKEEIKNHKFKDIMELLEKEEVE